MSAPVEYTLGEQARRWLGPGLIAIGFVLWAGVPLVHALRMKASYVRETGGGPVDIALYAGIAMNLLGAVVLSTKSDSGPAMDRYMRNVRTNSQGKQGTARVVAIHSKTGLFGPWIEFYATFELQEPPPPRTIKTTVVINSADRAKFRAGNTVSIRIDRDDPDEIAVML